MANLAALLKQLRKANGYSLRQVEALSKQAISHGYLSLLEKGYDSRTGKSIAPSTRILKVLASVYHYPYQKLLQAAGYYSPSTADEQDNMVYDLEDFIYNNTIALAGKTLSDRDKKDMLAVIQMLWGIIRDRENENNDLPVK